MSARKYIKVAIGDFRNNRLVSKSFTYGCHYNLTYNEFLRLTNSWFRINADKTTCCLSTINLYNFHISAAQINTIDSIIAYSKYIKGASLGISVQYCSKNKKNGIKKILHTIYKPIVFTLSE